MKDLSPMYELSTDLQEKASIFISEVYKFTSPFGTFYASLTNGNHYDNWIEICFKGHGVTHCYRLEIEALEHEEDIPNKLVKYCVLEVLTSALVSSLKYNIRENNNE